MNVYHIIMVVRMLVYASMFKHICTAIDRRDLQYA